MRKRYGSKRRAKEEVLARYASFIYLGNVRYGFAAASLYYFGILLAELTAGDADKAALLAGITKSPGEYAPTLADNQKPLRRRNQILALMVKNHFITAQTAPSSQQIPIHLAAHVNGPIEAPAAAENALEELKGLGANVASDIGMKQLLEGRIQIYATIDERIQRLANAALENGLNFYEKRHPKNTGLVQGLVVVLRNSDSAILAEAGGRRRYKEHNATYSDDKRVTPSMRQPGSARKPIVYLAAFRQGALDLDTPVPDEPISVATRGDEPIKWISNFDNEFKGIIPVRQALAESRNAVAIWNVQQIAIDSVLKTARDVGIRTLLHRYDATTLGASEVTLLELANAYRMMASAIHAEPYVIAKIEHSGGDVIYSHPLACCAVNENRLELSMIQEGLRGVVRLPSGTAHALDARSFPHGKQHCRISERQRCGKRSDAVLQIAGCRRSRRGANEILPRCRQDAGNERLRASGHPTACRLPAQRWAWQDRFYQPVKNVCRKHGRNCVQNRRRLGQFPINRAYL